MTTNYTLNYHCDNNPLTSDMSNNYWQLKQVFNSSTASQIEDEVFVLQDTVFADQGFGFLFF